MSTSSTRRCVAVVAAAAMASCADAASVMLKMKDNAMMMRPKGAALDETVVLTTKDNSGYNLNTQNFTNMANITEAIDDDDSNDDSLSAVWYLAAFGGLVLFFFVVTCSELFFGNPIYAHQQVELPHAGYLRRHVYGIRNHHSGPYMPETPPPPYHLFAPPSYDDTVKDGLPKLHDPSTKKLADVYVVPIHTAAMTDRATTTTTAVDVKMLDAVMPQIKFK